jgi:hypothetical protein
MMKPTFRKKLTVLKINDKPNFKLNKTETSKSLQLVFLTASSWCDAKGRWAFDLQTKNDPFDDSLWPSVQKKTKNI